jgi:translation initiation factor IF-2
MRDTSEFQDANEQAKPTPTRARSTARSKSDSSATGNQGQGTTTTPTPRRRTSPDSQGPNRPQNGQERANTASAPNTATRSTPHRQSGGSGAAQPGGGNEEYRPNNSATYAPRSGNSDAPNTTGAGQNASSRRPGGATAPNRQGGATPNANRQGSSTSNTNRQGSSTSNTNRQGGATPNTNRQGSSTSNTNRQGAAPQQRPTGQPSRGGAPGQQRAPHGGSNRPGTPGHGPARSSRNGSGAHRSSDRRAAAVKEKPTGPISLPPQIVVKDLSEMLQATPNEVIRNLIKHGIFASINQVVEYEKAALVAQDLGFEPTPEEMGGDAASTAPRALSANEAMMATRNDDHTIVIPPVVTIMGHVDHGKTSLLDTIRKTKVAAGEAGGITQHIGAYQVEVNGKKITFLDTPGHEAFTAMRARGAQGAHIAIIVVAADDGVMPQTREAIDHARAAKVPIIIALNKIDKANANPDHVKQQLADIGVVIEEYGGETVCVPVSARRGEGIDELLEYILLVAELQDIRANPNRLATGVIIEAKLEKNSGPQATVLVQQGTLKMGDNIVVGSISGKVRAMFNDRGKRIQKATPSTPVSLMGLPEVPQAGDRLEAVADERTAKQMAEQEAEKRRDETMPLGRVSLDTLYMQMQEGQVKELNVVLKSDVQGTSEAIKNALSKVGEENLKVRLIREGIGNISETDIHLAAASGAIVIGFNVKVDGAAQRVAQKEAVDIRFYNVIYKLIDDIQAALVGMLEPTYREAIEGHAEVIQTFKAGKSIIAGCRVIDGKLTRSSQVRVKRKNEKVYEGKIASLRRGKDDVREVLTGYECGIVLEDFTEIEVGDIVETFNQERVQPGA